MSFYAKVLDGKVINIIIAEQDFIDVYVDNSPGTWLRTDMNIKGGIYYDPITKNPHPEQEKMIDEDEGRQRKNFAQIGGTYDWRFNAFADVKLFEDWILNKTTFLWEPPTPKPTDGQNWDYSPSEKKWIVIPEGNGYGKSS